MHRPAHSANSRHIATEHAKTLKSPKASRIPVFRAIEGRDGRKEPKTVNDEQVEIWLIGNSLRSKQDQEFLGPQSKRLRQPKQNKKSSRHDTKLNQSIRSSGASVPNPNIKGYELFGNDLSHKIATRNESDTGILGRFRPHVPVLAIPTGKRVFAHLHNVDHFKEINHAGSEQYESSYTCMSADLNALLTSRQIQSPISTPRSPGTRSSSDLFFYGSVHGSPRLLAAPRIPRIFPGSWTRPVSTSTTDLLAATGAPTSPLPPPTHRRSAPASSPPPAGPGPESPGGSARGLRLMANVTKGHDYIWRPRYIHRGR